MMIFPNSCILLFAIFNIFPHANKPFWAFNIFHCVQMGRGSDHWWIYFIHSILLVYPQQPKITNPKSIQIHSKFSMTIFLFLLLFPIIFFGIFALDSPPQLVSCLSSSIPSKVQIHLKKECLENAIRLHFVPDQQMDPPETFSGHIYLKGFFFSAHCHLDYSRQPIGQPFYMHIPYRSECQVKRERSNGPPPKNGAENGEQPQQENGNGVMYSIVVNIKIIIILAI